MSVAISEPNPDKRIIVKSWYSTAIPLVTAMLSSTSKKKTNRINPVQNKQNNTNYQKNKTNDKGQELASASITNFITKRLHPKLSRADTANSIACNISSNWRKCLMKENLHIHFKSPYVVAGGQLSGTVVIESGHQDNIEQLCNLTKELELSFVGVEAVYDTFRIQSRTNEFLNRKIDFSSAVKTNKLWISFSIALPTELNGTFSSKKGSIEYYLLSKLENPLLATEPIIKKQNIVVYPNIKSKSLRDAALFYTPIVEDNKQLLKSEHGHVIAGISMPRTLWISGAPIYLSLRLHNLNLSDKVIDTRLQLVCQYEVQSKSENSSAEAPSSPIVFFDDVLSQVSLANSNWWRPSEPSSKDCFTMSLDVPSNLFSIQNQKLINVSFFVRVSIYSQYSSDIVAELPITIAHPISLDPPPGNYIKSVKIKESADDCRPFVFQDDFNKQQKAIQIIDSEHSSFFSGESEETCSNVPSSYSILTNSEQDDTESLAHLKSVYVDHRFTSLKKNFSTWSSRLSRKLSLASRTGNTRPTLSAMNTMLKISSPLISDASSIISSYQENDSIDTCSLSPPSILNSSQQQQSRQLPEKDKSTMKFGQMRGPKCFGHQPDCLGDAGLDIRTCFNVSTATEALQSYAAEKVEIASIPICPEPVILSDHFIWKEGLVAPPEKCEIHASMLAQNISDEEGENYDDIEQPDKFKDEIKVRKYPSQAENQTNKRMLASSRHLRNVQRKGIQASQDSQSLLTLPDCGA